jgi:hypothetical protein
VAKSLQKRVEEDTYQIIDEIADELEIEIPFYPEVYRVSKNLSFKSLGLSERDRDFFGMIKDSGRSAYLYRPKIILIGEMDAGSIAEEAGHFLHFVNSELSFSNKNSMQNNTLSCIIEMLGFFCSKLIDPNRENYFSKYSDILEDRETCLEEIATEHIRNKKIDLEEMPLHLTRKEKMWEIAKKYVDMREFVIYQQGYGLGEKLFDSYISGLTPKKNIKKLMLKKYNTGDGVLMEFLKLKYNILHFS